MGVRLPAQHLMRLLLNNRNEYIVMLTLPVQKTILRHRRDTETPDFEMIRRQPQQEPKFLTVLSRAWLQKYRRRSILDHADP